MANKQIKGITVEIGGDTTKLSKALDDVNKKSKSLKDEIREVDRALKLDPTNVVLLSQKQQLLSEAISNTKDKLKTLREAQEQIDEQYKRGDIGAEQYRAFQREIESTEAELRNYQAEAEKSGDATEKIGSDAEQTGENMGRAGDKMIEFGAKVEAVGEKMTTVTGKIVDGAKQAYAAWTETDAGYDIIIQKTGATGEALDSMNQIANNIFERMPVEFSDIGTAVGEVNTRFASTGQELEDLSEKFLIYAQLNGTSVNSSVDNVSALSKAFGMTADEAGQFLDVLTVVGQQTGIDLGNLESALASNSSTFKEMGLSAAKAAQLMGQFEINGVDTTAALTALKKAQQNATKEGLSLNDALSESINVIKNASTETEALQAASELFGAKGAAGMAQAIREGRVDFENLSDTMSDFEGATKNTFEATLSAPEDLQVSLNQIKLAMSDLAEVAINDLKPVFDKIRDVIKKLTERFKGLSTEQKENILKFAGIVAAIGPVLIILGNLATIIGTVINIMLMLKPVIITINALLMANPVGLVIAAIAAVIAILVTLYNHCEGFRNFVNGLFDSWKIGIGIVKDVFVSAWQGIKSAWNATVDFFKGLWEGIKNVFSTVGTFFHDVFLGAYNKIKSVFTGIRDFFVGIWDTIKDVFSSVGQKIGDAFSGAFKSVVNAVFEFVENKINGVFDMINGAIGFINEIPGVNIGTINPISLPRLAKGGVLSEGSAIVAEAGPELLSLLNGKVTVTPLTSDARNTALNGTTGNNQKLFYNNYTINATVQGGYDITKIAHELAVEQRRIEMGHGL